MSINRNKSGTTQPLEREKSKFDKRRHTYNIEKHQKIYGNHVPEENLITTGIGLGGVKKKPIVKTHGKYKSSTVVTNPFTPKVQIIGVE